MHVQGKAGYVRLSPNSPSGSPVLREKESDFHGPCTRESPPFAKSAKDGPPAVAKSIVVGRADSGRGQGRGDRAQRGTGA